MAGLIGLTAADIDIQDALGAARWEYDDKWVPHPVVRLTTTLPIAILQYLEWKLDPTIAAVSVLQIAIIGAAMIVTDRYVKLARVV